MKYYKIPVYMYHCLAWMLQWFSFEDGLSLIQLSKIVSPSQIISWWFTKCKCQQTETKYFLWCWLVQNRGNGIQTSFKQTFKQFSCHLVCVETIIPLIFVKFKLWNENLYFNCLFFLRVKNQGIRFNVLLACLP